MDSGGNRQRVDRDRFAPAALIVRNENVALTQLEKVWQLPDQRTAGPAVQVYDRVPPTTVYLKIELDAISRCDETIFVWRLLGKCWSGVHQQCHKPWDEFLHDS